MAELTPAKATEFMREAARFFRTRGNGGEDRRYWSNFNNAKNCDDIADLIERLTAERDAARRRNYDNAQAAEDLLAALSQESESCAKVADQFAPYGPQAIAAAIRARAGDA